VHKLSPFHLAIPVKNLKESRQFYGDLLGCEEGRSSDIWIDYNFFGHQLVCHESEIVSKEKESNPVDGKNVPIPHFGVVLEMNQWCELRDKLLAVDMEFVIKPYIRFEGQVGEQATMFFYDPSGNALEFKAFADIEGELFKAF
jgi:extradiol dioxygenase family protein